MLDYLLSELFVQKSLTQASFAASKAFYRHWCGYLAAWLFLMVKFYTYFAWALTPEIGGARVERKTTRKVLGGFGNEFFGCKLLERGAMWALTMKLGELLVFVNLKHGELFIEVFGRLFANNFLSNGALTWLKLLQEHRCDCHLRLLAQRLLAWGMAKLAVRIDFDGWLILLACIFVGNFEAAAFAQAPRKELIWVLGYALVVRPGLLCH